MATLGPDAQYLLARQLLSYDDAANLAETIADNLEPSADVAALTDNSGGVAVDKTIAVVTLPTALTDNGGGTADATVEAQAAFAASVGWDGATVFPSAADEAALTAIALAARNNMKEFTARQTENLAAITACRDAIKELATQVNLIRTNMRAAGLML